MKRRKFFILGGLIGALFVVSGCIQNFSGYKHDIENMQTPRLMVESRSGGSAGMSGATLTLPISGTTISVEREPIANEFEILDVDMVKVDLGLALVIKLDDAASRRLYRNSVTNNGNRLVLTSNGKAIGARRIDGAIQNGQFYTFVEIPDEELGQFVIDLKASIAELQTRYKY